jgi:integrase
VLGGIDPVEERRDAKLALLAAHENSFEAVARAWHKVWAEGKHARYADDVMGRLERNVFPNIGHKPVAHIEPKDIVRMMERIQGRGATDIARRVRNTCSQIFRYAITRGLTSRNPSGEPIHWSNASSKGQARQQAARTAAALETQLLHLSGSCPGAST